MGLVPPGIREDPSSNSRATVFHPPLESKSDESHLAM